MKKRWTLSLAFALFLGAVTLATPGQLLAQIRKVCCVAGSYNGTQINTAKPNCPQPQPEKFTMIIKQEKPCTGKVWGTITDSSGTVNNWTGILTRGLGGCCTLSGNFLTPGGNTVKFRGSLCTKLGKWQCSGTWVEINAPDPCKADGSWKMTQVLRLSVR